MTGIEVKRKQSGSEQHMQTKNKAAICVKKMKKAIGGRSDASLTVEAAFSLPLLLYALTAFLFWIQFFGTQEESMYHLNREVRALSQYAYLTGESELTPEEFSLWDASELKFTPGSGVVKRQFVRQAVQRPFTGRRYTTAGGEEEQEETVYVTETGSVYHSSLSCTHLKLSVRAVAFGEVGKLRNENGAIYYPCEICGGGSPEAGTPVYLTREGNRYHSSASCRGLLRKVRSCTLTEALEAGKRPCSRCGKEEKRESGENKP